MAGEAQLEAMLDAFAARLRDDAVITTLAPGGVYQARRPQDVEERRPFVTFRVRPGGRRTATLSNPGAARTVMVEVLGIVRGVSTEAALRLDARFDEILEDHPLELVAPWSCTALRREMDTDLSTTDDGVELDRLGGLYRVWLTKE